MIGHVFFAASRKNNNTAISTVLVAKARVSQ
jgi:hypothetical protein